MYMSCTKALVEYQNNNKIDVAETYIKYLIMDAQK